MDGGIRFANTRQDATAHPSGNIDSSCRHAGQQGFEPVWKDGAKASNGSAPQQRQPILQILQRANQSCSRETRSEEHTSELQSLMRISYAVFCLKKKKKTQIAKDKNTRKDN